MDKLNLQPWDEFTDVSKYGVPNDVQTILDRLQSNVKRFAGNYAVIAGTYIHPAPHSITYLIHCNDILVYFII